MGGNLQLEKPRKNSHTGRTKVKSGCRTCKIRKVKCDEGRPACHRCVSTGRVCDGYGIWGGGNAYGYRPIGPKKGNGVPWHTVAVFNLAANTEEKGYFDWFRCRTATKLPGIFASSFWDKLVFQASSNEPAVLHAVLALSSVHKRGILDGNSLRGKDNITGEQEEFMLQQYSKAISNLQPHFSANNRASIRVALVTCVVFISLEFLRGHYRTAQTHLQNGLKLVREIQSRSSAVDDGILIPKPSRESIDDDWIIEAFVRLHVQVELLKQGYRHPYLVLQASEPDLPALTFQSMNQARKHLDRLLDEILHLTELCRQQGISKHVIHPPELLDHQRRIQAGLASWLRTYKASKASLQAQMPVRDRFAYQLLYIYHTMADIMAHACVWPACELIFDSHANDFVSMITHSIYLWKIVPSTSEALFGHGTELAGSIADIGSIPPLYYTALKCRIHRVRLQAIKLLDATSHKEGIWDSKIAACIARKVMEIEERDFYKDVCKADDFPICSFPEEHDFLLPALPDSYRIHEVQVLLPDAPRGNIILSCRQRQDDESWEVFMREYDVLSQCWIDRAERKITSEI